MGISERKKHIKVLENLLSHYQTREKCEGYYDSTLKDSVEALQYAISSLKTDLKYDLMYEGEDIYTKADMVAMLEELQIEIDEEFKTNIDGSFPLDGGYDNVYNNGLGMANLILKSKIDKLKENDNGGTR